MVITVRFRLYSSDGHALIDLMMRPGEDPPEVGKRVLCRHPFEESKRAYVMPHKVESTLKLMMLMLMLLLLALLKFLVLILLHKVESMYKRVWDQGRMPEPLPTIAEIRQQVQRSLKTLRQDHKRSLNPTPYKVIIILGCYNF